MMLKYGIHGRFDMKAIFIFIQKHRMSFKAVIILMLSLLAIILVHFLIDINLFSHTIVYSLLALTVIIPTIILLLCCWKSKLTAIIAIILWVSLSGQPAIYRTNYYLYPPLENLCKLHLRRIYSAELEYYDNHNEIVPLSELLDSNYFTLYDKSKRWSHTYKTTLHVFNPDNSTAFDIQSSVDYIIIAIPVIKQRRFEYLRTFAINSDGELYAWIGEENQFELDKIELANNELWQPLR